MAHAVLVGASLAEAGQRAVDDVGVPFANRLVVDAQPVDDARAELLEDDIGGLGQLHERLVALLLFEVERDAPFPAVDGVEEGADAVLGLGRGVAGAVADVRGLHFDHVRARVRQQLRGVGAREQLRKVEDTYSVESHTLPCRGQGNKRAGSCRVPPGRTALGPMSSTYKSLPGVAIECL